MELPAHIKLVFVDTPEKFQPLAADIVPPLIGLLGDLCALEEKFYARDQAQKASRPGGIYATQAHPNSTALWERYREAYTALLPEHGGPGGLRLLEGRGGGPLHHEKQE